MRARNLLFWAILMMVNEICALTYTWNNGLSDGDLRSVPGAEYTTVGSGWQLMTVLNNDASQKITVKRVVVWPLNVAIEVRDLNCGQNRTLHLGDKCSFYFRLINDNPKNLLTFDTFKFGLEIDTGDTLWSSNDVDKGTIRLGLGLRMITMRIVESIETDYFSSKNLKIESNQKSYVVAQVQNSGYSPESISSIDFDPALQLIPRSSNATDDFYGKHKQCSTKNDGSAKQVSQLVHSGDECLLIFKINKLKPYAQYEYAKIQIAALSTTPHIAERYIEIFSSAGKIRKDTTKTLYFVAANSLYNCGIAIPDKNTPLYSQIAFDQLVSSCAEANPRFTIGKHAKDLFSWQDNSGSLYLLTGSNSSDSGLLKCDKESDNERCYNLKLDNNIVLSQVSSIFFNEEELSFYVRNGTQSYKCNMHNNPVTCNEISNFTFDALYKAPKWWELNKPWIIAQTIESRTQVFECKNFFQEEGPQEHKECHRIASGFSFVDTITPLSDKSLFMSSVQGAYIYSFSYLDQRLYYFGGKVPKNMIALSYTPDSSSSVDFLIYLEFNGIRGGILDREGQKKGSSFSTYYLENGTDFRYMFNGKGLTKVNIEDGDNGYKPITYIAVTNMDNKYYHYGFGGYTVAPVPYTSD
jgi:hypothetical protein